MKDTSEKYYLYINKETDKLLNIQDTFNKKCYLFTERDFGMLCNLFGYEKEDFEKVGGN